MLLDDASEIDKQRLPAEYWQTSQQRIETALRLTYQRVASEFGEE